MARDSSSPGGRENSLVPGFKNTGFQNTDFQNLVFQFADFHIAIPDGWFSTFSVASICLVIDQQVMKCSPGLL